MLSKKRGAGEADVFSPRENTDDDTQALLILVLLRPSWFLAVRAAALVFLLRESPESSGPVPIVALWLVKSGERFGYFPPEPYHRKFFFGSGLTPEAKCILGGFVRDAFVGRVLPSHDVWCRCDISFLDGVRHSE